MPPRPINSSIRYPPTTEPRCSSSPLTAMCGSSQKPLCASCEKCCAVLLPLAPLKELTGAPSPVKQEPIALVPAYRVDSVFAQKPLEVVLATGVELKARIAFRVFLQRGGHEDFAGQRVGGDA